MSVFNTGSTPHRQHFFGNDISEAPLSAYKNDKFYLFTEDNDIITYIFNGLTWELDESSVNIKIKGIATDGTQTYASYEKDPQGKGVARVVIAAYPSLTLTHSVVAVGTTTTQLLPANPNRKYLLIVNDSDTDAYCSFGVNAVVGQGIPVNTKGNYEQHPWFISTQAINAIHNGSGNKNFLVTEGL